MKTVSFISASERPTIGPIGGDVRPAMSCVGSECSESVGGAALGPAMSNQASECSEVSESREGGAFSAATSCTGETSQGCEPAAAAGSFARSSLSFSI